MERDPRRRKLGSVSQVLELVNASAQGTRLPARRRAPRPAHEEAATVLLEQPVPGGAIRTLSGALVVMPTRPLRGIRAPRKPEATPLIGRPRPARGA